MLALPPEALSLPLALSLGLAPMAPAQVRLPEAAGALLVVVFDPISLGLLKRPGDYGEMDAVPRPSHADYTYHQKYGLRDPRGGGRSSARETTMRVAAAVIVSKPKPMISVRAAVRAVPLLHVLISALALGSGTLSARSGIIAAYATMGLNLSQAEARALLPELFF